MLNLLSFADVELTFGEAALYSVIGFVLIIVVLAVMALLIALLNYLTKKGVKKQPAGKPQEDSTPAPGSCGSVKLFDVPRQGSSHDYGYCRGRAGNSAQRAEIRFHKRKKGEQGLK